MGLYFQPSKFHADVRRGCPVLAQLYAGGTDSHSGTDWTLGAFPQILATDVVAICLTGSRSNRCAPRSASLPGRGQGNPQVLSDHSGPKALWAFP